MYHTPVHGASPPEPLRWDHEILTWATAHRTLIVRKLKGLEEIIPFTCVHWHMENKGQWSYELVPREDYFLTSRKDGAS